MRKRTASSAGDNLWIPAGLGQLPATFAVATLSVFALVAVFMIGPRLALTPLRADGISDKGPCTGAQSVRTIFRTACSHGDDDSAASKRTALIAPAAASVAALTVTPSACGDGTSGNRIAFYYAYFAGQRNRIDAVRAKLVSVVQQVDDIVRKSSARFGAEQSLRITTDRNCVPVIQAIELPATDTDSFAATVRDSKLRAIDRKYVLFTDTTHYCGLATLDFDDEPGNDNVNNGGPSWARVDLGCWAGAATAHEIFHMLGAVQQSGPHYDRTGHCTDGYDLMCNSIPDSDNVGAGCANRVMQQRLDCNGDDYYNPNPPAGSYLATHWNTANSSFLDGGGKPWTASQTAHAAATHS